MAERETLQKLLDDGAITDSLHRGSPARHAIASLQTVLHWLGFDRELEWERFRADGDYRGATTAAVAEFASRNGSTANGTRVTDFLAAKILARYDSLEELKQVAADVDKRSIERLYRQRGPDRVRIAALQTLLNDLGFGEELHWDRFGPDGDYGSSTTAAVAAFAARERLAGDGTVLTAELGRRVVDLLSPFYGDAWNDPSHRSTPTPESLSINSVTGRNNKHYLKVSDGERQKQFQKVQLGLYTLGTQKPMSFVDAHGDKLLALGVSKSEINVMIAVAENEGNLDAINTWDNSYLSFGLFQWTAGQGNSKGELPGLLARIKSENRDLFDEYCGQHALDVAEVTPGFVYGHFSLRGATIKTAAAKEQLREASWAFYFWRAGQDPDVQAMEVKHALSRLDQFYSTDRFLVDGKHRVSDLVTSEYGVGLVLDNHVNRPGYVKECLAKALDRTGLGAPAGWGTDEERKLIDAYLRIRVTHGRSPMTDAEKRARVTKKYVTNGAISEERGSFRRSA